MGTDFENAWISLSIMFLYPIHQSLGQITSTVYMATNNTKHYVIIGNISLVVSIIVVYLFLAPNTLFIPGLNLGATGVALKMVLVQMVFVNIQIIHISNIFKWKFDWIYQPVNIVVLLSSSFFSKYIMNSIINNISVTNDNLLFMLSFMLSGIIYIFLIVLYVYLTPDMIGFNRSELVKIFRLKRKII